MLEDSAKLTRGLIIFSAIVSDYERLDFANDALAGVRANYFNSGCKTQSDKTTINLNSLSYNLSYHMSVDNPLSWKITRDNRPYQSVKKESGGIYCVLFYEENGIIFKRQYYDNKHNWLRTEYYNRNFEGVLLCRIYPKNVCGIIALQTERFFYNGKKTVEVLFPSIERKSFCCSALLYTNVGMLWYDASFCPQDFSADLLKSDELSNAFNFRPEYFSEQASNPFDLESADYLSLSDEDYQADNYEEQKPDNIKYSAYDTIEKILTEAHKSNKNLFGEIITQTADDFDGAHSVPIAESDTHIEAESIELETTELSEDNAADDKINCANVKDNPTDVPDNDVVIDNTFSVEEDSSSSTDDSAESAYDVCTEDDSVLDIINKSGVYHYYGSLDDKNKRTGRGRTVTPEGTTAYEGEYYNDLRDGFGVSYYRSGDINFVGEWSNNNRSGAGVGYRHSDGTMHIGKWNNNSPEDFGARFDKNGNFIDVCQYSQGIRNGKCVSFDDNGNIVISLWKNGEIISRKVIELGDDYGNKQ